MKAAVDLDTNERPQQNRLRMDFDPTAEDTYKNVAKTAYAFEKA